MEQGDSNITYKSNERNSLKMKSFPKNFSTISSKNVKMIKRKPTLHLEQEELKKISKLIFCCKIEMKDEETREFWNNKRKVLLTD